MMLKRFPAIHPVLLAVYPVLFLYSRNIGQAPLSNVVEPILVILAATIAGWGLLRVLTRSWHKSAIITSLFLLLFFSYGHIRILLGTKESVLLAMFWLFIPAVAVIVWGFLRVLTRSRYWSSMITTFFLILFFSYGYEHARDLVGARTSAFLSLVWLFLFLVSSFRIIKTRKPLAKATMISNVFASVLVAFALANIAIGELATGRVTQENADVNLRISSGQTPKSGEYPDIYFIILDAYARQDVLQEIYNFDNSDFIQLLRNRGFYVADKSATNYCQTGLSIGSCLNLAYLNIEKSVLKCTNQGPLKAIIEQSFVRKFLKEYGYRTVSFASSAYCVNIENTDFYLRSGGPVNALNSSIINTTPLPDIIKLIKKESGAFDTYRRGILYILDNIGRVPKIHPGPKFVFAHVEAPHPPFVFGPDGEPVTMESKFDTFDADWLIRPGRLTREQYRKAYCDQVRFVNSRILKVIDEIISNSSRPPIILILGDHGPRSELIWEDPAQTNMKECLSNLGAFYLPGGGEERLYPDMTLVNLFRVVFNHYFGAKLELLPDRCYFSTAKRLYGFHDVTDRVRQDTKRHRIKQ